jgi:hypothetical protein
VLVEIILPIVKPPFGSASEGGFLHLWWYNNYIMARDHFSQASRNPRYNSSFYKNQESKEATSEIKIELFFLKIFSKLKRMAGKK